MQSKKFPWMRRQKRSAADLPLQPPMWMGNRSNTEYFHTATPQERQMQRMILERADTQARRLGMDRREFLASSMGMFTTLAVINQVSGCGGDSGDGMMDMSPSDLAGAGGGGGTSAAGTGAAGASAPTAGASGMAGTPTAGGAAGTSGGAAGMAGAAPGAGAGGAGGMAGTSAAGSSGAGPTGSACPYLVPREATCAETELLSGDEFIFDIQTHSFDDGEWRQKNTVYASFLNLLAFCGQGLECFDEAHYGQLMFVESDTTVSVITSWPAQLCTDGGPSVCGLPLSNEGMRRLRDSINEKNQSQRVVNQIQVMPNDRWELQRDVMTMASEDPDWKAVSWKAYPAWGPAPNGIGGPGYFLNDDTGRQFVEHGLSLGIPNFAIHKGLPIPGFDVEHNQPIEIGATAVEYPEANFIIYHSGIGAGTNNLLGVGSGERQPFDESITDPVMHTGVNQLIASMLEAGLGHGSNVYAEMGSAWSNVMRDAVAAQHYIGKLLKYVGEDNVVWGTDSILYGSPQDQIEAFRMFTITEEYQEMYGYPALTPEIKAKIFGLNAARLFCVDPATARCRASDGQFAMHRRRLDSELGERRWTAQHPLGPTTRREFLQLARINIAKNSPGA